MLSNYLAVMILKWRTFFFISSITYYNGDEDSPNALLNNSESLLDILISDSSVVVVNSGISYKSNILAFLAAAITSKSSSYLILYNRYYSTFYF